MKISSLVLVSSILAVSCSEASHAPVSQLKEETDKNSSMDQLGDIGTPTYDALIKTTKVQTKRLPWVDTYWALTEQGLSRRWSKKTKKLGMADFFESQTKQDKEVKVDPTLSPADKYDILFRWRHNIEIDADKTAALIKGWETLDTQLDLSPEPQAFKKTLALTLSDLRSPALADFRKQFPMSSDGWNTWLSYSSQDEYMLFDDKKSGDDWSWMGSCHGWSPAALMEETPKHSVLAKIDKQEVLVTEGDLRGLLTKSWADHSPRKQQYFVGRRCEKNAADPVGDVPHGEDGRGFYGNITFDGKEQGFYVRSEIVPGFVNGNQRVYPLSYEGSGDTQDYLLETYSSKNGYTYVSGKSVEALRAYAVDGDKSQIKVPGKVEMLGCWDVNPATFHMALLQKIGKENTGLVMDRTRTGQVWNQPVFSAAFTFGDRVLRSQAVEDKFHSDMARSLLVVEAKVKWIGEPSEQQMTYTRKFDEGQVVTSTYTYQLEFDRKDQLIGGEWISLAMDSENPLAKPSVIYDPKQVTPDFLFGFSVGSKPVDNVAQGFDYSGIVDQLHKCSLSDKIDGSVKVGDKTIQYSNCVLTKAP
ncbi:MAG: hypothetical protein H7249_14955 [Chitinophagaceae bacterium]|nr:hypothetical protein [Oligoflexus sp.]